VRTIVKGKNLDIPAADRRYAQDKLRRLERLLDDRTDALVELSIERHRSPATSHIVEVTLVIDGRTVRGEASSATHHAAIDEVVDRLERRAVAHKRRPLERRRPTSRSLRLAGVASDGPAPVGSPPPDRGEAAPRRIVKSKRFAIEPMFEEDAVSRMEELGHGFFIFVNAENEQLAVLYRRRDGDYGLIEPTIGGSYTQGLERRGGRGSRTG
jgi:putative sigma-54 modulation protein